MLRAALLALVLLLAPASVANADILPGPGPARPLPPLRPRPSPPSPPRPQSLYGVNDVNVNMVGLFAVMFVVGGAVVTLVERRKFHREAA